MAPATAAVNRSAPSTPAPAPTPEPATPAHPFAELLRQNREASEATGARVASPADAPGRRAMEVPPHGGLDTPRVDASASASPATSRSAVADEDGTASPEVTAADDTAPADTPRSHDPASKARARASAAAPKGSDPPVDGDHRDERTRPAERRTDPHGGTGIADGAADPHRAAGDGLSTPATTRPDGVAAQLDATGSAPVNRDTDGVATNARIDARADAAAPRDLAPHAQTSMAFGAALASAGPSPAAAPMGNVASMNPHDALTAAVAGAPAPTLAAPSAPTEAIVAAAVTAPEFAQAFAVQVTLLAAGGVQHAELHLNPAELGPVSVHIALDGQQARVDFGADAAATRHAIEAGLPELASALRDAGFTLAGGGVAAHAGGRGRDGGGDEGAPGARRDLTTEPASAGPLRRLVRAGGIDLYA